MSLFQNLGLSTQSLRAIAELGFEEPSEIQAKAIPKLLENECDFIGLAQTGTGKTAAFGLPLLEFIDANDHATQALILAPTRELGQQIAQQITLFSKYWKRINAIAVYGGASISEQIRKLRSPQHIVIATPGRLCDLIDRKVIDLSRLRVVVLDEADEMLNMGFKPDLDRILDTTPMEKMTWLFSATMSKDIRKIVKTYMSQPFEVRVNGGGEVNVNIDHRYTIVRGIDKTEALKRFLDVSPEMHGIVFTRTKRMAQNLSEDLYRKGYRADALHGDLSQHQRDRVMRRFKEHDLQVLIATDVAARGIDVNDITHVFHYDLPDDPAFYTHRSGRTARAGKTGFSISFVYGRDKGKIAQLARTLGIHIEEARVPSADLIRLLRMEQWAEGIRDQEISTDFNPRLFDEVSKILANVSRNELIAKLLSRELGGLHLSEDPPPPQRKSRDRDDNGFRKKGGYQKSHRGKRPHPSSHKPHKSRGKKKRR